MDIVGKHAVFQHVNNVADTWNGVTVYVAEKIAGGFYRVTAMLMSGQRLEHLALREELTIVEG